MSELKTAERASTRKARRKACEPPVIIQQAVSPELDSALESLVAAVTDGDDPQRDLVVSHVLKTCLPRTITLLCQRLARRVGSLPAARAALRRMGKPAVSVIIDELLPRANGDERVVLAGVAAEIGAKLPPRDRVELMEELMIARRLCRDEAVSEAIGGAIAGPRQVDR